MRQLLSQFIYSILFKWLGPSATQKLLIKYLRYTNGNLQPVFNELSGIMKYETLERSGEVYLLKIVLPTLFRYAKPNQQLVFFDVGANKGEYAQLLSDLYPAAALHLFEPNRHCLPFLQQRTLSGNTFINQKGLSAMADGNALLYIHGGDNSSELASLQVVPMPSLQQAVPVTIEAQLTSLDVYCDELQVDHIDFLKIDTEGHELEVLKGASRMLAGNTIKVIQFEFNEMNIVNRVFLKDFYDILPGYHFYRLDTDRLIALHNYHPANEIFQFQNIVAIHPSLTHV